MPERKVWTQGQDKVLRLLKEQRGQKKWASIARLMQSQFGIMGRTGKQCRQRFHNHLDSAIVNTEWSAQEQQVLYQMHEDLGNKWSLISQKLPGRSDNCVKNHFYSKLRKSVRKLNRLISQKLTKEKIIKESLLSRIIKTTDSKFKTTSKIDEQLADFCNTIKNRLFSFGMREEDSPQELKLAKNLISDIQHFDRDYRKGYKGLIVTYETDYTPFLKPPPPTSGLIKRSSSQSWQSERSDDTFLSSSSFFSSSDLSDCQAQQYKKGSKTAQSASGSHRNINDSTLKVEKALKIERTLSSDCLNCSQGGFFEELHRERIWDQDLQIMKQEQEQMKVETFVREYGDLIESESQFFRQYHAQIHYSNMIYDDTPVIARILGPNDVQSPLNLFEKGSHCEDDIEFKLDKMQL